MSSGLVSSLHSTIPCLSTTLRLALSLHHMLSQYRISRSTIPYQYHHTLSQYRTLNRTIRYFSTAHRIESAGLAETSVSVLGFRGDTRQHAGIQLNSVYLGQTRRKGSAFGLNKAERRTVWWWPPRIWLPTLACIRPDSIIRALSTVHAIAPYAMSYRMRCPSTALSGRSIGQYRTGNASILGYRVAVLHMQAYSRSVPHWTSETVPHTALYVKAYASSVPPLLVQDCARPVPHIA
eukprot:678168-Rhodomonas_salina.1